MLVKHIFRKLTGGYKFTKSLGKLNQRIFMDNIKMFTETEKELIIVI